MNVSPSSSEEYLSVSDHITVFYEKTQQQHFSKNLYHKSFGQNHGLCLVCSFSFCFSPHSFQSFSNLHSLFSYYLIHEKYIYIYSIQPIRCFLSLRYYFMYRNICNTV